MPTYQYACTACDHAFEQVQSFSEDSLTVCPECRGRLRKVFNAVGVVFKGSGFYRTDSRSNDTSEAATTGSSDGSSKESTASKPSGDGGSSTSTSTTTKAPAKSESPAA